MENPMRMKYFTLATAFGASLLASAPAFAQSCSNITEPPQSICTAYSNDPSTCGVCTQWQTVAATGQVKLYPRHIAQGHWFAACGVDPQTRKHDFKQVLLDGTSPTGDADPSKRAHLEAVLAADLNGKVYTGPQVKLIGIITNTGVANDSNAAAEKAQLKDFLQNNYIFTWDHTPPQLVQQGRLVDNGQLTNPICPIEGGVLTDQEIPNIYGYKVEFTRADCVDASGIGKTSNPNYETECDIPEGDYKVSLVLPNLDDRQALPSPTVPRDGTGAPYSSASSGNPGWLWALNNLVNVNADGSAKGTIPYQSCGGTCPVKNQPDASNSTRTEAPYVLGEATDIPSNPPAVTLMGPLSLETYRDGDSTTGIDAGIHYGVFDDGMGGAGNYRIFAGGSEADNQKYMEISKYNVVFPNPNGTATPYPLGKGGDTGWGSVSGYGYNLAKIVALEITRDANNQVPQNVVAGTGNFNAVMNTLANGYNGYRIYGGMAGNNCALVKAGAKMLNDVATGTNARRNLIYIGGCPTGDTAEGSMKYNNQDVNWSANSNASGGVPGVLNGTQLANIGTTTKTDLPAANLQCFKDVKNQVDNLFVVTDNANCGTLADTVSAMNVSGSQCANSCKLGTGAGSDNVSDCAAKILSCMVGESREVQKR
jgi:hypothetical protein